MGTAIEKASVSASRTATVLQILRIPVLLGLLLAASSAYGPLVRAFQRIDTEAFWLPWAWLVLVGTGFSAVALIGRGPHQSRVVLIVEVVTAAVVAFTPPLLWVVWFGLGRLSRMLGAITGTVFAQALALAWLIATALTLVRSSRVGRSSSTST